jgi:hypothetical protein
MVFESFEVGCRVLAEHISDSVFLIVRTPEVSNVGGLPLPHVVKSMVKSLLLGYEPLIDFE